jgi:uncharacterized membrane-anchored protein
LADGPDGPRKSFGERGVLATNTTTRAPEAAGKRQFPARSPFEVRGKARLGKRTKDLVKRLGPDDVAIIHHRDLDRMAAEDLVECGVRGVVNVAPSTSSRYPNPGPLILVRAGVHLVDAVDAPLFEELSDGDMVIVRGGTVLGPKGVVAEGMVRTLDELAAVQLEQQERIGEAIQDFAENTLTHIRDEPEVLVGKLRIPDLRTDFRDRHVLIVVRGTDYRRDLRAIRPYIRDLRPVLVGVDGGGDALMESGLKPDVIIGDMDSASDKVLKCGAELVVHAYRDGAAPGRERLQQLGVEHKVLPAAGTSQDVAMLLAYERGARLIVTVGSHFNLIEFLDKDRAGMSSTFLTRLRVGEILVDTKGVSRLYPQGPSRRLMMVIVLAALVTFTIVVLSSPPMERLLELLWLKIQVLFQGT